MRKYDVIIVGLGASGSMCALTTKNNSVAVIDQNVRPIKKLLITGNGRCNLTNTNANSYNVNIENYLKRFNVNDTLNLFHNIGLEYYNDECGRIYPISNDAKSVVDVLWNKIKDKCDYYMGERVTKVIKDGLEFKVTTTKSEFVCNKLVIASGGDSVTQILDNIGVKYRPYQKSLVGLKAKINHNLNNIRLSNVLVTAQCEDKILKDKGEVLIKEDGLSGIVIFNLSCMFARVGKYEGKVCIDLIPNKSEEEVRELLQFRVDNQISLNNIFVGMFKNAIGDEIYRQAKVTNSKVLNKEDVKALAHTVKNLTFEINGALENNQVYSGGVELNNLNDNLEYKDILGLYFIGEVCDVDGECGGYNLQWAWTSGHIVGEVL